MTRVSFNYLLFYNALIGLLGREPDSMVRLGDDGFYDFYYLPKDDQEKLFLAKQARVVAKWLDRFEIMFSGSRCEFGRSLPSYPENDVLQIKILLERK